jgi:TonB family protein
MGFRALLFSKSVETNAAMTTACASTQILVHPISDIFTAIEQVKKRQFSCIIVDWAEQPEANFLLKRARESTPNQTTVSIVIVDHEPTPAEMHDNHLDFLIYRPISAAEADEVLAKACEKMRPSVALDDDDDDVLSISNGGGAETSHSVSGEISSSAYESSGNSSGLAPSDPAQQNIAQPDFSNLNLSSPNNDQIEDAEAEIDENLGRATAGRRPFAFIAVAAFLLSGAIFAVWKSPTAVDYLSRTSGSTLTRIRNSAISIFYKPRTSSSPAKVPASDAPLEANAKSTQDSNLPVGALGVAATISTLLDSATPFPKAYDFPLPVPVFERPQPAPVRVRAAIPESMKTSPPISPPVVVTVNPAQMMPVSTPVLQQPAIQQTSEPVAMSEGAERALLIHSVNPIYPPEGAAQKLHGPVVLQARIGRDGSVEDLKIVRGYFILGRAATQAVKQWTFQPYTVNGRAVSTQTFITINF